MLGFTAGHNYLIDRQGILISCVHPDSTQWIRIPASLTVIQHWLNECGFESRTSHSGHIAASLSKSMGGPRGMHWLGYPLLIESLNHIASLPGRHVRKKKAIEKLIDEAIASHTNFEGRSTEDIFGWLLRHGAFRVGLTTSCTACRQYNWHTLEKIRYRLTCDHCGIKYAFPSTNPWQASWTYSLAGPFSVPNYVAGGYGAVAALHAITRTHSTGCMWSLGVEIKDKIDSNASWHEIDAFVMVKEYECVIPVFIEAKSGLRGDGGIISEDEIERAEYLLRRFPDAVVAFSTMGITFEAQSIGRLKALVERLPLRTFGRQQSVKPVMLLGQRELFSAFTLSQSWKDGGGKHAEFAKTWRNVYSIVDSCEATQALHLDWLQANDVSEA